MTIRELTSEDVPAIAALAFAAEREGFRFLTRFLGLLLRGEARRDAETEFFLGCFDNVTLIGLGGVTPDPYHPVAGVGRVRHLHLAEPYRRRGYGRQLLSALEGRAKEQYGRLRLRTDTAAAAQFYERLGYRSVADTTATHERMLSRIGPATGSS